MTDAPSLRTARVLLRDWREADLDPFAAMNADPAVMAFFPRPLERAESEAAVARIREHLASHGFGLWAVEVPGVAEIIGFVGLAIPRFEAPFTPCVEIDWRLARAYWGRGYATEAALAALEFGFRGRGLDEIVSFTARTSSAPPVVPREGVRQYRFFGDPSRSRIRTAGVRHRATHQPTKPWPRLPDLAGVEPEPERAPARASPSMLAVGLARCQPSKVEPARPRRRAVVEPTRVEPTGKLEPVGCRAAMDDRDGAGRVGAVGCDAALATASRWTGGFVGFLGDDPGQVSAVVPGRATRPAGITLLPR